MQRQFAKRLARTKKKERGVAAWEKLALADFAFRTSLWFPPRSTWPICLVCLPVNFCAAPAAAPSPTRSGAEGARPWNHNFAELVHLSDTHTQSFTQHQQHVNILTKDSARRHITNRLLSFFFNVFLLEYIWFAVQLAASRGLHAECASHSKVKTCTMYYV